MDTQELINSLKKDELVLLASELNLDLKSDKFIEIRNAVTESEVFKRETELVKSIILSVRESVEDQKREKAERLLLERNKFQLESERLELEKLKASCGTEVEAIKLRQLEKELELENARKERLQQKKGDSSEDLESLIKSVKTLTISPPTKSESFNVFFQSIERAFKTKGVPDCLKSEILLNILGEKVNNLMIYIKEDDLKDYVKMKSIILKEFQPTPQECLHSFRVAQKRPCESFVQFATRLSANFEYYCQLRNVKDFKSLCELVVSDKLVSELDRDLKAHIAVKQGEKWFEPATLGRECDLYLSSRGKQKMETLIPKAFSSSSNDYKRDEGNSKPYRKYNQKNVSGVYVTGVKTQTCLCKGNQNHALQYCPNFKSLSVNERFDYVKQNRLCFKCFSLGCNARSCKFKSCFCGKPHHSMIHFPRENKIVPKDESQRDGIDTKETQCNSSVSRSSKTPSVLLLTCSVYASGIGKSKINKLARILCDNGSERSWCTKDLVNCLNLKPIREERLLVFSFGATKPVEKSYEVVELKLSSRYKPNQFIEVEVLVSDTITAANVSVPNEELRTLINSRGLDLADCCEMDMGIEVLIGADVFWQIVESSSYQKIDQAITCVPTIFGFALQGSQEVGDLSVKRAVSSNFCAAASDIKVLWELESLGIKEKEGLNENEKGIVEDFKKNLKFVDGKYETELLWKLESKELENNYFLAKKQFDRLERSFAKNDWIAKEYGEVIRHQIQEGVIEECTREEREYFMPHRAVVREDKETTKVRVVFNCSSKSKGNLSLNDCLETGPNLNPNILDMILKFRSNKIAFNGDIEKAFLMIGISEKDRKFLKFLWFSNNSSESYKIMRMKRLPFGCSSSPFILSCTIKHHIKKFEESKPKAVEMLNSSLYVDDLFYGANDVNTAFELSTDAVEILKSGGFNLRKLRSNSQELERMWNEKGLSKEEVGNEQLKILGMNWDPGKDELTLELKGLLNMWKVLRSSKRCVLQTAAKIFDPVGIASPFVVRIKLLLQEIWERGCDWDEELPEDLSNKWLSWCKEVSDLDKMVVPRYCFRGYSEGQVELHVFCDASLSAYGAVSYFRYEDNNKEVKVSFCMSKSKVAPLKRLSLPRLELMGMLIGAKIGDYCKSVFGDKIGKMVFWSDSTIALYWVKGCARRWKQFVSNRVVEIQGKASPSDWFYCPTVDNPADLLTRGVLAESLVNSEKWWCGPNWLRMSVESRPEQIVRVSSGTESEEVAIEERVSNVSSCVVKQDIEVVKDLWNRVSVWSKLLRVIAWCLRFLRRLKGEKKQSPFLETVELQKAHNLIIRLVQRSEFSSEITLLEKARGLRKSRLVSLNPFLDSEGLLRVGGRLRHAILPETVKHQLILPKNHPVTRLIVRYYHLTYMHGGMQLISSAIRQKYWIVGAKSAIRKELRRCVICARLRAETSKQIMGDLPAARVNPGRAFLHCGTDFAGPFLVTPRRGRGVRPQKMYVCVFVCFSTKAVHLEIVSDLSTLGCIAALKRFVARRGKPIEVYSDCGTNFVGAKNYLKSSSLSAIGDFLASEGVKWNLNVPSAPHFGGLWEAAVKSMKFHLKRVIGASILSQEEFCTVLAEVEAVLNSRPLVATSDDPGEPSVITPGHFLIGADLKRVPEPDVTAERIPIRERWRLTTQISQDFWKSWSRDYLTQLQVRNKWRYLNIDLKVNDLVLIKEENLPPLKWRRGRVIDTFKGADNRVRTVFLKTASGELKRPIHKLVRLPVED